MEYDVAVKALQKISQDNWLIGEIADSVEPKYGDDTLGKLAEESGVSFSTIKNCRNVWRAYDEKVPRGTNWSVCREFASQPDRFELIEHQWSVREAREEIQKRNANKPKKKPKEKAKPKEPETQEQIDERTFREARDDLINTLTMLNGYEWDQAKRDVIGQILEVGAQAMRKAQS
jgi:hypothetical protein